MPLVCLVVYTYSTKRYQYTKRYTKRAHTFPTRVHAWKRTEGGGAATGAQCFFMFYWWVNSPFYEYMTLQSPALS